MKITFDYSNTEKIQPNLTIEYDRELLASYMRTMAYSSIGTLHFVILNGEQYSKYVTGKQAIFFCFPN